MWQWILIAAFSGTASAALPPEAIVFESTRGVSDSSPTSRILPPGCIKNAIRSKLNESHSLQMNSCGKLEALYGEATRLREVVLIQSLSAPPAAPGADSCQTEARERLHESAIAAGKKVDERLDAEERRVLKICRENREWMKDYINISRKNCPALDMQESVALYEKNKKEIDGKLNKAKSIKEEYLLRNKETEQDSRLAIADALACQKGLK